MTYNDRFRGWQDDRDDYRGRERGGDRGRGHYPAEERDFARRDDDRFYDSGQGDWDRGSPRGSFSGHGLTGQMYGADVGRGYGGRGQDRGFGGYGRESYGGQRGFNEDRGFFERAGDEIATWFGSDDAERRRRQDARQGDEGAQHHRGKGPRGYTRSDDRIREDVQDRLTDDPYLDATEIEVTIASGEVTLNGTVNSRNDKRRAEDIADNISGVKHVQNNLRVQPQAAVGESTRVL
ncbi:MAG TPA: BON domain-containing protein [Geminicoccus sp.]|jgi:osmotically-inducible protein OsmY|uniref:BON domain-containing protein n=1 Tax=Geminicoccus sp. TaxID=2024832 RepID=UPI002E2EF67A|nr:BON domain-containing protein [Geminicoccus sp.]HEX2526753.1 BON domain-containing protein [Geminicoccus sp.]